MNYLKSVLQPPISRDELARSLNEVARLKGDFLLRSGQRATEYFDKYRFEAQPKILAAIAAHLVEKLPHSFEALAGLEMGGIPVATALSLATGKPVVFVRKEAKSYGTCQFAEGLPIKGLRLLVVEDVITTGGQVVLSAKDLREAGAIVEDVVCVIDRGAETAVKLKAEGLSLVSLFTKAELDHLLPTT